jgi:HK97 family phage major capsid protein
MPFISRTDASALMPTDTSREIIKAVVTSNPVLKLAKKLPNLSSATRTMPVTSALATAYFVNGDTGLKQTTSMDWTGIMITAEELAVIVPIPEAVLADADYDIWGEIEPALIEAFDLAIAQAIFYGTNIPATWTTALGAAGLLARCTAAGHIVSNALFTDTYEAIMGEAADGTDGLLMRVEADGYLVNGHIASMPMRGRLRNVRDANGNPIFVRSMQEAGKYELDGSPIYFPTDGSVVDASSWMFSGAWNQLVYAFREDITYKLLTEAVIQDAAGNILYNLAQQDMVALRAVMRLGVALPNPINRLNATALTRCPFAVLTA